MVGGTPLSAHPQQCQRLSFPELLDTGPTQSVTKRGLRSHNLGSRLGLVPGTKGRGEKGVWLPCRINNTKPRLALALIEKEATKALRPLQL